MQQDPGLNTSSMAIDVGDVLAGVCKRKSMVLIIVLVAVGLAFAYLAAAKPRYSATAKVLVENLETPFTKAHEPDRQDSRIDERDVLSQVEIAKSPGLARQVISSLSEEMQTRFTKLRPPGLLARLMIATGFKDNPAAMKPDQRALAKYNSNISVYPVKRSKVIVMRYTDSRPETAAAVANKLAEKYVEATRTAQSATTDRAQDWLSQQVDTLRQKVVDSEVAVEKFRAEAGLLRGPTNTLNSQELSELNSQIILASAAKAEARARASSIRELLAKTGSVDGATDVLNSVLVQRLREQQIRVRRNLAELSTIYLNNHPRIKAVKQELTDLDRQVRSEALKIVDGLEQQAKIAASREASLRASLNELKQKATSRGVDEVKLRALEREAKANRLLLESFLARSSDAAARVKPESQPGLARIIATASVPSAPYFPKKGPIVALAGIGGLVLGLGLAFVLEVMAAAGRMETAQRPPLVDSIETNFPAPAASENAQTAFAPDSPKSVSWLCQIPRSPDLNTACSSARAALFDPGSAYAGTIRTLSSWVTNQCKSQGISRFAMVALPDAGLDCATATVGLARCLVAQGIRVVVVEADEEANCIDKVAPLEPNVGLAELLDGKATFSDVIIRDQISSVHFLRSGLSRRMPGSNKIDLVLEALDHAYEIVLLNNGVTRFPAVKDHAGVTACHGAVVLASAAHSAEAESLCGALTRAGLKAAEFVEVSNAATRRACRVAATA